MAEINEQVDINFKEPAIYKIIVQGEIDRNRSDLISGLQITVQKVAGKKPITSLIGRIDDQSALSGILTMLNDMHLTVISVNMLSEIDNH